MLEGSDVSSSSDRKFHISIPSTKRTADVIYYVVRTLVSVQDESDPAGSKTLEGSTELRFSELEKLKKVLTKVAHYY